MKFLVDMGISPRTVAFLKSHGHDATHLLDANLERLADPDILNKTRLEGRVLLTHDLDFGELLAASGAALPSVVIFRLQNMRPEQVNRYMLAVIKAYEAPLTAGAVLSVSESRVRLRHLPITPSLRPNL